MTALSTDGVSNSVNMIAKNFDKTTTIRAHIKEVNNNKVSAIYDFTTGIYKAHSSFYTELNRVLRDIMDTGKTKTLQGQEIDVTTTAGAAALSMYLRSLYQMRDIYAGLAEMGLANEKKLWQIT
ncbi:hypothetical protein HOC37_07090 [bacterium]|nr:hypothetical protein [bacterium]MBT7088500.1 hypothetical protein [bacterium]